MGVFLEDVREQPVVLGRINDFYSEASGQSLLQDAIKLGQDRSVPIILTGMGSSLFASRAAATYLWSLGRQAWFLETSELLHYGLEMLANDCLLILVSQSGETVEIKELLSSLSGPVRTIGVTNEINSTLAKSTDVCLPILAGDEGTTSSKTYTATLAVLLMLGNRLGEGDFALAQDNIDRARKRLLDLSEVIPKAILEKTAARFLQTKTTALVGRGPGVATALQGALTIKELVKIPAEGMEAAQFRHGPLEIAGSDLAAIVVITPGKTENLLISLARDLSTCGAQVVTVRRGEISLPQESGHIDGHDNEPYFSGLTDIYPIQLIAGTFAEKLGHDGTFKWITKVTSKE
ncbi:MAG: SIS domain-containing protein [Firmicutes bacterium]|nr:SIS domain-containing protein [Bacillota bacterium]